MLELQSVMLDSKCDEMPDPHSISASSDDDMPDLAEVSDLEYECGLEAGLIVKIE